MARQTKTGPLSLILKISVSALLLSYIVKKAGPGNVMKYMHSMNPWLFLLSVIIYIGVALLVALRWRILLDYRFTARKLFSLHMIGNFFNMILPSTMGGDAVKAFYLYREMKSGGDSFGSVFLDRYLGLSARLSLGLISSVAAFSNLRDIGLQWVVPAIFIVFLAGSAVVFRLRMGKRFAAIEDFYRYFLSHIKNKQMMFKTFLLSLVIQILLILMIAAIALGIGRSLSFTELFVFVPIIMTIMIVPVSIAGFGVREGAFVMLFSLTGIPASVSVSISFLWYLSTAAASLIGLIEYLRYRKQSAGSNRPPLS
jgi:uncharacterized membrane protein YbhN (UPF0104 family)